MTRFNLLLGYLAGAGVMLGVGMVHLVHYTVFGDRQRPVGHLAMAAVGVVGGLVLSALAARERRRVVESIAESGGLKGIGVAS